LAVKIDRADPIPEGAEPIYFNRLGTVSIPTGLSAYAIELYEQTGAAASVLTQPFTFAGCPKIYDATGGQYLGLSFDGGDKL